MSQLIYPAVWLAFCRGLPLAGSELHGNLYFFMFYKPGSFFINALSLTNTLYSGMKNKLSLGFSDTKQNWKETACHRPALQIPSLATFQAFFAYTPLPFLHIPEDSRRILRFLNPKNLLWYIPYLFIIVPAQERESRVYHWGWKGSVRYHYEIKTHENPVNFFMVSSHVFHRFFRRF